LFAFVFGEEWRESGEIAKYLIPWFYVNLLVSPISHLPVLLNKQKSYFWVNIGGTVFVLGSVLVPLFFPTWFTHQQVFIFISGAHCVFITFLLTWFFYQVNRHKAPVNKNEYTS
jgi:O-antigen/teichoic acid export membrane protein